MSEPISIGTPAGAPLRFTCERCGECCRAWTVPVDLEHINTHLRGVPWIEELSTNTRASGNGQLLPALPGTGQCQLNTSLGERLDCVFLDPEGLCRLHSEIAAETKPPACQQFPFHFVRTPRGLDAFLDPACKAVAADRGAPVPPGALEQMLGEAHVDTLPTHLELRAGQAIDFEEYCALVARVNQSLTTEESIAERLYQTFHILRGEASGRPSLDSLRADPLGRRLSLSLLLLMFRSGWERKSSQQLTGWARVLSSLRMLKLAGALILGAGQVPIEARGIVVSAAGVERVLWKPETPAIRQVLEPWLAGFGSRHEIAPRASRAAGILLTNMLLVRWFASALALQRAGSPEQAHCSPEDVQDAIQLCEKFGGRRMMGEVEEFGILGRALSALLEGPNLARYVLAETTVASSGTAPTSR